ncbi:glutaredoxin family protein [Alteribacter natronophilus]|uniref:glutaredoxin family protein n=1 Tax=Alteribacter natronophilus TaxID=2583810 RepID=UPI00110E6567|nr:glutaredoxin family protein [Alteribacter natronophilus]TMW72041.1 glutaredoxin family protein [Alteribacter natronophilus]
MSKPVIVYSTKDCVECDLVKKMLDSKGVDYEVRDVMTSRDYQKEVETFGFMGVPVTVVDGEAVKGMSPDLEKLIEKAQ